MAGFSGVLQLTDLDDFITPSQVLQTTPKKKITCKIESFLGMH